MVHTQNIPDFEDLCKKEIDPDNEKIYKKAIIVFDKWSKNYNGSAEKLQSAFIRVYSKYYRDNKISMKKYHLVCLYSEMVNNNELEENKMLEVLFQKKPSRNISGIASITLVMSPTPNGQSFSCKHNCYYCPNEPAHKDNDWQEQPRSYLYNEPAVRRANENLSLIHISEPTRPY